MRDDARWHAERSETWQADRLIPSGVRIFLPSMWTPNPVGIWDPTTVSIHPHSPSEQIRADRGAGRVPRQRPLHPAHGPLGTVRHCGDGKKIHVPAPRRAVGPRGCLPELRPLWKVAPRPVWLDPARANDMGGGEVSRFCFQWVRAYLPNIPMEHWLFIIHHYLKIILKMIFLRCRYDGFECLKHRCIICRFTPSGPKRAVTLRARWPGHRMC